MDVDAWGMDVDGAWTDLSRLQPARWSAGGRQGGVGELGHVDAAASAREGDDLVSPDAFGGIADLAASGISRAISNRRDLSRRAAGGPSASPQCLRRTGGILLAASRRENLLGTLWRSIG